MPTEDVLTAYDMAIKALEQQPCEDTISRQAAIDTILGQPPEPHYPSWYAEQIKELPSAQPEINCSEFPNNSDTISRQDMVSRQRLLSDLKELVAAWNKYPVMAEQIKGVEAAIGYVEEIPSAQPQLPEWAKKVEEYRQSAPQHIHNPLAWALYQVWKEITAEGGHDEH